MLATMTEYLDSHPQVGLAYCSFRVIDSEDRSVQQPKHGDDTTVRFVATRFGARRLPASCRETPLESLMSHHAAYPSVSLMRRTTFERTKGWDPDFRISEDKDMVLQMAMLAPVHFVPRQLVMYRRHDTNVTATNPVFPSLWQLEVKWWNAVDLTVAQRARVRGAVLFDRRLTAQSQLQAAGRSIREGALWQSVRLALQSCKSAVRFWMLYVSYSRAPAPSQALPRIPEASGPSYGLPPKDRRARPGDLPNDRDNHGASAPADDVAPVT
jgi:hypothetical protein